MSQTSGQAWKAGAGPFLWLAGLLSLTRLLRLGEWGLWIDEAYTWADLHHALDSDQIFNPWGYRAIGAMVALLGGEPSEGALRLAPCLVGIACVPLTWWAFRPVLGSRRAAFAALLVATSAWHVYWSQSARFYTLAQAVSLLGVGLFLRGSWQRQGPAGGRILTAAGIGVVLLAGALHPSAALLAGPLVGVAFWRRAGGSRPWPRGVLAVSLALGALLVLLAGPRAFEALANHASQKPVEHWGGGVAHLLLTCGYFFTPPLLAGAAGGAWSGLRRREPFIGFALAVVVLSAALVTALATQVVMSAQYAFVLLPWAAVLASALLAPLARDDFRRRDLAFAALLLLPALANMALYFVVREGERPAWRAAYEFVDAQRRTGDLVLGMAAPVGEFYLGGANADLRHPETVSTLSEWFPDGPRRWTRHARRIWVVVRPQWFDGLRERDAERIEAWLRSECRLVRRFAVDMEGRDLDVHVYLRE
ncbi:MAG TPA: glycosyltransferase family 39 protein [Planctomycetota bacterium]|nr:glycosyltransferase family 39 protein [Planctomycetota bacterium]